ncbi:MAG: tetratricopeptide repeat protein [Planctomycetia bacterium]|nr:tetratricopeptide repeat protein [Planctomycetia bacterium]
MKTELHGKRIFFLGKLAGMSRREAEKLSRQLGAKITGFLSEAVNMVVVGEAEYPGRNRSSITEKFDHLTRIAFENGNLEILTETDFWKRLNIEPQIDLAEPLYTSAMLAELICVPLATIRLWVQHQFIKPRQNVGKLLYFDFHELLAAKHLIQIFSTGLSLEFLHKRVTHFQHLFPEVKQIISQLVLSPDGKDIYLRKEGTLFDQNGQQYFDFDSLTEEKIEPESISSLFPSEIESPKNEFEANTMLSAEDEIISEASDSLLEKKRSPFTLSDLFRGKNEEESIDFDFSRHDQRTFRRLMDQEIVRLCENAWKLEKEGNSKSAIELYRSALAFGGSDAGICFHLAELLQRSGDVRAAKERYYMVIELDEDYVEARFQLGKILLELNELEEAIAAFQGVLSYQPFDIQARLELGRLYLQQQRFAEAEEQFIQIRSLLQDKKTIEEVDYCLSLCQRRSTT